jgi:RimJ/RimL family protein N-acetyltransferase
MPGTEGRGLMTEAARAIRDWAFGPRGLPMLVSYIDPANTRSIALAERLGGRRDPHAPTPHGKPMGVWRIHRGAAA